MSPAFQKAVQEADRSIRQFERMLADSRIPNIHPEIKNTEKLAANHLEMWLVIRRALTVLERLNDD